MFLLAPPDWLAWGIRPKTACSVERAALSPLPEVVEAPPGGSIVVYVVLVEPPPNTVGITIDTDSWMEVVVQVLPVLKDVGVSVIPPSSAEAPPLESITLQAAV